VLSKKRARIVNLNCNNNNNNNNDDDDDNDDNNNNSNMSGEEGWRGRGSPRCEARRDLFEIPRMFAQTSC